MTNELPKELIISALELCGKSMHDMPVGVRWEYEVEWVFSHPSFFYYLLSPGFIKAYVESFMQRGKTYTPHNYVSEFGIAIHEYQSGNSEPIISLLSKICPTNQTTAH